MNKFSKMRVIAAFTLALTMLASVAAPSFASAEGESVIKSFEPRAVEIDGENEALSGWQYYFFNGTLNWYYQSDELFVRATKNGRTGNAMEIERKKATDELWVSSYSFAVKPDTEYNISSFVKTTDSSCKLVWCVKELDENGNDVTDSATNGSTQYIDRYSFGGKYDNWTEASFTRKTEATTKKMILRIRAEGTGIINIDDLTVAKTVAPNTVSYTMMGIGNDGTSETPASYNEITADDIVNDSSDGDGKALRLDDHDVFNATFGMLPHGYNYEISFKYKSVNGERMSFYLDNVSPSGERAWYADGVSGGSTTEWTSYSYKFSAVTGQTDIVYFRLASYGTYYIDEFEVKSINEYVLNGTFENSKYYHTVSGENHYSYFRIVNSSTDISGSSALFNDTSSILSASNISTDSADGDGKSVKLSANDYLKVTYAPKKLDDDKTYTLSFKYKKLDSVSGSYIRTRLDHVTVSGPQGWNGPNGEQGVEGEWVTYSFDFTTNANPDGQHVTADWVTISAQGGDFLIDDISVTCKTFDDMQYMPNGNFSGAYTEGYQLNQNFNVAKQSDGTYVFTAASNTSAFGMANCYMRLNVMSSLPTGKEYTLSFDYRSGGAQAVRVFYGLSWTDATLPLKNILTCGQATSPAWVHKEVTFTHTNPDAYLEIYGNENYSGTYPSYIKNIQITDKSTGETFITNQSLVAPDKDSTTAYSSDFGAGSADYTWKDWNIVNGGIYGLTFEDGNKDYKVCLNGSAGNPATAVTKDIDVAGARLISVDKKIYYTTDPAFGSNLTVTVLAGENEIAADENGLFSLPEGTTTVKIKFSSEEYVTFKKVFVKFTGIGTAAGASIRTNTPYGIRWKVRVKTAEWNKLVEAYGEANVKAGVIVAPLNYLGSGETAVPFTIDAFKAANKKYVDIVTDTFNAKLENEVEGYSGFYASLVNIKAGNLNREFIARSYVAVTKDGVTAYYYGEYSAEDNARSIYEVGKGAIASETESENVKTFVKNEVLDKIADVTVKDGVAAMTVVNGYTSPYSVSINGKVLTITAMDGADVNLSEVLKIVCVNGKNYIPAVSGNLATVTIN